MDSNTLRDTIALLAQGVGVGFVLSFLFEKIPQFQNLSGSAKAWIVFFVSVLLPVLATAALQFVPAETWVLLEPYWRALSLGFLTWGGTQAAYKLSNAKANGA